MPLVPPDRRAVIVKLSLDPALAQQLAEYAAWAQCYRTSVVEVAITRLLATDTEWQAELQHRKDKPDDHV